MVVAQFPPMNRIQRCLLTIGLAGWLGGVSAGAAQAPNPAEVLDILRTNLPGLTDAQLQLATVRGVVRELAPRVWLVGDDRGESDSAGQGPALIKAQVFPPDALYLRVGRVSADLPAEVEAAFTEVSATNDVRGVIVDLRFAGGRDFAAAAAAADLAVPGGQLLLDWGAGQARSTEKSEVPGLPTVVLVNQQTEGAAEALAGVLRDAGVALIIGANTAGRAMMTEEFKLSNGQTLCIARRGVRLGSGVELTSAGLTPDIVVRVAPADEQTWFADPFRDLSRSADDGGTNTVARAPRRRINEAELVRARREGTNLAAPNTAVAEEEPVVVRDPALARALDLLKALAVVREWQSK